MTHFLSAKDLLQHVVVVMVRPKGSLNVGMACRLSKNMELGGLVLVSPHAIDYQQALRMAPHADDYLHGLRVVPTLADALSGCGYALGTSARGGGERGLPLDPHQAGQKLMSRAVEGMVALVLGPEDHGLSNAELAMCGDRAAIQSNPDCSSLNITHALAVFGYECRRAALQYEAEKGPDLAQDKGQVERATLDKVEGFMGQAGDLLDRVGFLNPQNPHHMLQSIRRLILKAEPTPREVQILRGIMHQISWYMDQDQKP